MRQNGCGRLLAIAVLTIGISTGCQGEKIAELEEDLSEANFSYKKLAQENDTLKANIDSLKKENKEMKAELGQD